MKKKYVKPEIKDFGKVNDMTLGNSGSGADGNGRRNNGGLFD